MPQAGRIHTAPASQYAEMADQIVPIGPHLPNSPDPCPATFLPIRLIENRLEDR